MKKPKMANDTALGVIAQTKSLVREVQEVEAELAEATADNTALRAELEQVTRERDEAREHLASPPSVLTGQFSMRKTPEEDWPLQVERLKREAADLRARLAASEAGAAAMRAVLEVLHPDPDSRGVDKYVSERGRMNEAFGRDAASALASDAGANVLAAKRGALEALDCALETVDPGMYPGVMREIGAAAEALRKALG